MKKTKWLVICVAYRMPATCNHISSTPSVKMLRPDLLCHLEAWVNKHWESRPSPLRLSGLNQREQKGEAEWTQFYLELNFTFPTHTCIHTTHTLPHIVTQPLIWYSLSYHKGKEDFKANSWMCFAILGKPVVPLVKNMTIGSVVFDNTGVIWGC